MGSGRLTNVVINHIVNGQIWFSLFFSPFLYFPTFYFIWPSPVIWPHRCEIGIFFRWIWAAAYCFILYTFGFRFVCNDAQLVGAFAVYEWLFHLKYIFEHSLVYSTLLFLFVLMYSYQPWHFRLRRFAQCPEKVYGLVGSNSYKAKMCKVHRHTPVLLKNTWMPNKTNTRRCELRWPLGLAAGSVSM